MQNYEIETGKRLQAARKALNMKQEELGATLNVARTTIAGWERGARLTDIRGMVAFSNKYKIPLDWIYKGDLSMVPMGIAQKIIKTLPEYAPKD